MKIIRGIGKVVKPFVNVPGWMGWKQISTSGKTIKDAAQTLLEKPKASRKETFEEAVARMRLTDKDLQERMKMFKQMALVYGVIGLGLFAYCIYLFFTGHIAAGFLSFILVVLASTLAFRQHFWYFQIKKRKLGCTVKEWFNDTLGVGK